MARYGMDYGRGPERYDNQFRMGGDRGYGESGWGAQGAGGYGGGYGGMRSEGWGGGRRDQGAGYGMGYQGGGYGYREGSIDDVDTRFGGGADMGRGGRGRGMGGRFGGGMGMGGYGDAMGGRHGGMSAGGYGGRDMGYGGGYEQGGMGTYSTGGMGGGASRMRASELMTENPECVTADTPLTEVARKMKEMDVGIIPVVDSMEGRRLRGVITDRDIAIRAVAEGKDGKAKVGDCMTSEVETVNKNDSVQDVLNVMSREQVRRVPVTDREGRLVGIIAQADLAVEYGDSTRQNLRVERTIERISEPARPQRGGMAARGRPEEEGGRQGGGAAAGQGRGGSQQSAGGASRGRQAGAQNSGGTTE